MTNIDEPHRQEPVPAAIAPGGGIAAVRGAITVPANEAEAILEATTRLLQSLMAANGLETSRIVSAVFTATPDLDADFPAHAARRLGWMDVPLLGAREMGVPGALPRVVRVLLTVSGARAGERLIPVYLDGAATLRPDLAGSDPRSVRSDEEIPKAVAAPGSTRTEPPRSSRRVAILGLGQIGGSIGLALGRRGSWWRVGYDLDPAVLAAARASGAIDEAVSSVANACVGAALAITATPVDALPGVIDEAADALPSGAALVDTGSARTPSTPALERAVARGIAAVGGHPLAGTEGRGLAAARADLLEGATFLLLPVGAGVPHIVAELLRDLGAHPLEVDPGEHDRALARTSHLPYLVSRALYSNGKDAAARGLAGPGFRDMIRLGHSDPRMALAYCRANARELAEAWRELRAEVDARVKELSST